MTPQVPSVRPPAGVAPAPRAWYTRLEFVIPAIVVGGFILLLAMIAAVGSTGSSNLSQGSSSSVATEGDEPSASASSSQPPVTEAAPSATPSPTAPKVEVADTPYGPQPKGERAIVKAIVTAQAAADDAENDLQRGGVLRTRTRAICAAMDSMKVQNWTGQVSKLDANGDGKGVVSVEIADGAEVTTWNNSFSDIGDETLIEPDSKLFDQVMALEQDQLVKFSGTFFKDDANCLKESSLTLTGSLSEPEFIFRFSSVTPLP